MRDRNADIVIAGAGCAGLALAYWLTRLGGDDLEIVIIDPTLRDPPKKLWSFWGDVPEPARGLVAQSWTRMTLSFPEWTRTEALSGARYHTVRSEHYVRSLVDRLARRPNVRFVEERVANISDLGPGRGALVETDTGTHWGAQVFQSCMPLSRRPVPSHALKQHFGGWEIKTEQPQPGSNTVTLMDFSHSPVSEIAFHYVLPLTRTRRLVEYTVFSPNVADRAVYDAAVRAYIDRTVVGPWRVVQTEYGVIPMQASAPTQRFGTNVWNLGAMGGMSKASTGYTFLRSQRQAQHLATTLLERGAPTPLPRSPMRFALYDALFLRALRSGGRLGRSLFSSLFARRRFADVLSFLDEQTTPLEELRLVAALPVGSFLAAVARPTQPLLPPLQAIHT